MARARLGALVVCWSACAAAAASASGVAVAGEPTTLRVGTVAPRGSGWAREFEAFARYVEAEAKGALKIKL
ncbi:MAG TPA: hypothetical protein VF334_03790, partial [Polyangia bacterium]